MNRFPTQSCATAPDDPKGPSRVRSLVRMAARRAGLLGLLLCLGACGDDSSPWGDAVQAAARESGSRLAAASPPSASKGDSRSREYKVKAALLFNFLKYAKFPPKTFKSKKSPIKVLVLGKNPFGPILAKLLGAKKVRGRSIQFQHLEVRPKKIDAQLVFVSGLEKELTLKLIKDLANSPTILVGQEPGFAQEGGFINLFMAEGKVRFEIYSDRQKTTGVKLKAELLKLARIVKPNTQPSEAPR